MEVINSNRLKPALAVTSRIWQTWQRHATIVCGSLEDIHNNMMSLEDWLIEILQQCCFFLGLQTENARLCTCYTTNTTGSSMMSLGYVRIIGATLVIACLNVKFVKIWSFQILLVNVVVRWDPSLILRFAIAADIFSTVFVLSWLKVEVVKLVGEVKVEAVESRKKKKGGEKRWEEMRWIELKVWAWDARSSTRRRNTYG